MKKDRSVAIHRPRLHQTVDQVNEALEAEVVRSDAANASKSSRGLSWFKVYLLSLPYSQFIT